MKSGAFAVFAGAADVLPYIGSLFSVGAAVAAAISRGPTVIIIVLVLMLIEELRVELPGQQEQAEDVVVRERDDRGEEEYERRAEGMTAENAAAIAVEISADRHKEENSPLKKTDRPYKKNV